jgi:hypothetical protein
MGRGWNSLSVVCCGRLWIASLSRRILSDSKVDVREICCEDERWIELAQNRVQLQAVVLASLSHRLCSYSKMDLREICCEDGGLDGTGSRSYQL